MKDKNNIRHEARLAAPVTYQGGKGRLAAAISELIHVPDGDIFCDLCCGSGAVSLAMLDAGLSPERLVMVDKGPWGDFWAAVGEGAFDCDRLESIVAEMPDDPSEIKNHLEDLASRPVDKDSIYTFLLLQAGAFGGKAVGVRDSRWVTHGFRARWTPKPGCNRKSPVNPMMPMPATILVRMREIVRRCQGLVGLCGDVADFTPMVPAVCYIDPPYEGTTDYVGGELDVVVVAKGLGRPCYVSEGRALGNCSLLLAGGRRKGGISGKRSTKANEEWLSAFNAPLMRLVT